MADTCERCAGWRYVTYVRYPNHIQSPCPICNPNGGQPVSPTAPDWMKRFHNPDAWKRPEADCD